MSDKANLLDEVVDLDAEVQRLKFECDNWEETARRHANNEAFYRGIVVKIGNMFGDAAKTSDDGSVQQDVLALKVPELVKNLNLNLGKTVNLLRDIAAEAGDAIGRGGRSISGIANGFLSAYDASSN